VSEADQVPPKWRRRRLRFDACLNPLKSKLDLPADTEVSFVPMDAVGEFGGLRLSETRPIEEVYNGYTYFADGDICIAKITPCFENGKGALAQGLKNGIAFGTTELHVIRPLPGLDARFLFYLTIAPNFRSLGQAEMVGAGGQKRVPEEFLKDWRAPLPPFEIQQKIARFLDKKTERIDGLIEKKHALLDRLAEKRQAFITRAVTKGLNPDAPAKSTGVDWLGDIPAHWEVGNIRRFAKMKTGHTPSRSHPEYWDDCCIPWFTLADVWQLRDGTVWYLKETAEKISEVGLANSAAELLPAGTVIFSRTASVGYSGIMPEPMATSQDFWNWICGPKLLPEYLLLLFRSMAQKFEESTSGSTHKTIYQGIAAGLVICVAPMNEQHDIAKYVFARLRAVDSAVVEVRKSIDSLINYRAALIASAIAGKIAGLR
jgi:type I restriction enzyme, S subunit